MAPPVDPGPRELPYYGGTVEEGYHLETKYSKAAVLGGGVTFLGLYGITAIFAGSLGARGDGNAALALIPVAGPAISIGGYDFRGSLAGLVILAAVGMAFNTLAQAAGLGFFIYGIASPKQVQMKGPPKQEAMPALRFDARGPALVF